jgi:hypothetical protein
VQHNRGIGPERDERTDDDVRAIAWRHGKFTCVAVGPSATAASWRTAVGAP